MTQRRTRDSAGASFSDPDDGALRIATGIPPIGLDPTQRSSQQVLRENFWLRELLETRLNGMDKALQLLQAFADRTPTTMDVQHEVTALREVTMVRFDGIKTQLVERDTQIERASKDVKSAVDAAFAAAKEAVGEQNKSNTLAITKSEAGVSEQLKMLGETNKTNFKGIEDKIADMKDRLTIIESKTSISDPSTAITLAKLDATVARLTSSGDVGAGRSAGQAALWALIVGGLGLLFGLGAFIAVVMRMIK
jgi:hypothetical protein